jgi:hypothetical protein
MQPPTRAATNAVESVSSRRSRRWMSAVVSPESLTSSPIVTKIEADANVRSISGDASGAGTT